MEKETRGMFVYLGSVWKSRYFWTSLVINDLRSRYRRSVLGMGWSLLNPILMTTILCFAFCTVFQQDPRTFVPFLFAGLTIWNFIVGVTQQGCTCFQQAECYIRQHPQPMAIYPLRTVLSTAFHLLVGLVPVIALASYFNGMVGPAAMLSLVPSLVLLLLLGWSIAVLVGLLNVWFRDTRHLIDIFMQAVFYLTPIIYQPDFLIGRRFAAVLEINPLMPFLTLIRDTILRNQVPTPSQYLAAALVVLVAGTLAAIALGRTERQIIFHL